MSEPNIGICLTEPQLIELINVLEFRMNAKFGKLVTNAPTVEKQAEWDALYALLYDKLDRLQLIKD